MPREVLVPLIAARIKQQHHDPGIRIYAGEIASLVQIALRVSEREILGIIRSTVLLFNNVLVLERN
jgi:hypothetical protein